MALSVAPQLFRGRFGSSKVSPMLVGRVSASACGISGVSQLRSKHWDFSFGHCYRGSWKMPSGVPSSPVAAAMPSQKADTAEKVEIKQGTLVEHVVLFKFKDSVPSGKPEEIFEALRKLKHLDCVLDLSAGKALQIVGGDFTHVLHSRYLSKGDLQEYSQHPEHLKVVKEILLHTDDVLALDWEGTPAGTLVGGGHGAARIALIKLADAITEMQSTEVFDLLYGLQDKFSFIKQVSAGLNFSPSRSKGLNVGFLALFENADGLKQLNGNRELHAVLKTSKVAPFLDRFVVIDFDKI